MDLQSYVAMSNDQITTTSLQVAKAFGKQHKDVLKRLNNLDCSNEFASANFCADVQKVDIGNGAKRESKIYHMTKDGFMFLVMGFTGKQAAAIKEAYINAFNAMADELHRLSQEPATPLLEAPTEIDDYVEIKLGHYDTVGFEANNTTWIPENFMWRFFSYSSPAYFRKLFLCYQHLLPEGSYFEVEFDKDVGMGKNRCRYPIARDRNKFMIFNLDAIQILSLHSKTCWRTGITKWVMERLRYHAMPTGKMLVGEAQVQCVQDYAQLSWNRVNEYTEVGSIPVGRIHDEVRDLNFVAQSLK